MKLIVGLGNPGRKYEGTRHNTGFAVLAELARRHGREAFREKYHGEVATAEIHGQPVLLLRPLTYMNVSGTSVLPARDFYRIPNEDLLIVCDDFHLPLAQLRFRARGTAGGQKGLADILRLLGTEDVPRLRVGVGTPPPWKARWLAPPTERPIGSATASSTA
jgi:PTH1 family peptidyl-tRNA hydrolase